ncbi:MAG: ATP-binding response regulator [Endozoicomonas sp.]
MSIPLLLSTAQADIVLDSDSHLREIEQEMSVFFDHDSELTITDITSPDYLFRFAPWQKQLLRLKSLEGNAWLRLPFHSSSAEAFTIQLRLQTLPDTAPAVFKVTGSGNITALPDSYRGSNNIELYNLPIMAGEKGFLYIRLPASKVDKLYATLSSAEQTQRALENYSWLTGWLFALLFVALLLNSASWLKYRHSIFLLLTASILTATIITTTWLKLPEKYFPGLAPFSLSLFQIALLGSTVVLSLGAQLLFGRHNKTINYYFRTLSTFTVLTIVLVSTGLIDTYAYPLGLNVLTVISCCYCSMISRTPKIRLLPNWLVLGFAVIETLCVLAIFELIPVDPLAAIWCLLITTALMLLGLSIYFAFPNPLTSASADARKENSDPHTAHSQGFAMESVYSAMGHELRTPLNGVLGMSELLLSTQMTPKQQYYVQTLRYAGNELGNLINLLSESWKISSNEAVIDKAPFDVHELLEDCLQPFRYRAEQVHSELISFIHPDVPAHCNGDRRRLALAIEGVLTHAFALAENGEIMISINHTSLLPQIDNPIIQSDSNQDGYLMFQVSYTYSNQQEISLPRSPQSLPFHQVKSESNLSLNLYLAIQLIEGMGGHVGYMNQGSSYIWFALPHQSLEAPEQADSSEQTFSGKNLRALIIDDNKTCRQILSQQCSLLGLTTMDAEDGREALGMIRNEAYLQRPFDVVILDHHMPGMNGLQVIERLNEGVEMEDRPAIIMLTGASNPPGKQRASRLGISTILTKPVNRFTLQKALSLALNKHTEVPRPAVKDRFSGS